MRSETYSPVGCTQERNQIFLRGLQTRSPVESGFHNNRSARCYNNEIRKLRGATMFEKIVKNIFHAKPEAGSQVSAVDPRQPDGYAYRYPDGIRFETGGRGINGSEPLESISYYFGTPAPGE